MRVSVLIPTHQRPELLALTLDSLRRQTMRDFEVIIANDDTQRVAYDALDGLTGKVIQGPFGGCSAALNAALSEAQAPYLTVSSDDDLVLPDKLKVLSEALDNQGPETVAVFGWPVYTLEDGTAIPCPPKVMEFIDRGTPVTSQVALTEGLWVHGTAPMYRTEAVKAIGGWNTAMPTAEEWDMHHRLLRFQGDFRPVNCPVVTYRRGGKHTAYKGRRPREIMNLTYEAVR